jgi:type IV pilus assembly protein PilC
MRFTYQVRDSSGRIKDGEINAASAADATRQLRQDGFYILSLTEAAARAGSGSAALAIFQRRVSRADVIYVTNQLSIMVDAGVSLAAALDGIAKQAENPTLQRVLQTIQRDVEGGDDLSTALGKHPRLFDTTYVNLVKASEASGLLSQMLERIATQSRKELETRQKVRGALMYPGAMFVMCVGVCIFLLTYVFPKLTPMFATRKLSLPGPTKVMLWVSGALTEQWYWILLGLAVIVGSILYVRSRRWGRKSFDWMWLHLPVFGPLMTKVALSRSMRTLATTINAGVPMLDALQLSGGTANNVLYEESWKDVADKVEAGKQIHEVLEGNKLFPPTVVQMISSGEKTGKLGTVLNKVSDYFDREVETSIKTATSLIEPLMVASMGGVIGTIALAMLLPIFKLSTGK